MNLDILNETSVGVDTIRVSPSQSQTDHSITIVRIGDHYNGLVPANFISNQNQKKSKDDIGLVPTSTAKYTREILLSVKPLNINRKLRKHLFSLKIWKPKICTLIPHTTFKRCHPVSFVLLNVQSVHNNTGILCEYIQQRKIDIFVMTETWLESCDSVVTNELIPSGFEYLGKSKSMWF